MKTCPCSGELSELDSDVHSLASLRSCAKSWIEDRAYKLPAENALRWGAFATLVGAWPYTDMTDTVQSPMHARRVLCCHPCLPG